MTRSLWGGGFLSKMGVLDYSGGYVIHLSSGTAGKPRKGYQYLQSKGFSNTTFD